MNKEHDDGGPAFGVRTVSSTYIPNGAAGTGQTATETHSTGGLSLRDYFAAKAMHGLLVNTVKVNDNKPPYPESVELARSYADASYLFADAMLEARKS